MKSFHRLVGLSLYVALLGLAAPVHAGDFEDAVNKGNAFVAKKDYESAIKEYQKALAVQPNDSRINLLLGLTYANTGKFDEAIRHSTLSIQAAPSYSGYHNLGLIFANQGEYERAADAYRKALEIEPNSYRAWYQLGLVYSTSLDFEHAIESYQKSLEANPAFTEALVGLGSAYYWSGSKEKALEQVEKLKESNEPTKARALENWIQNTEEKKSKAKI